MKKSTMMIVLNLLLFINGVRSSFLGVAPQDEAYYATELIKCKDGSNKFSRAQLNDDFCDCPDGTDEPGTSACPSGRFYCRNAGHSPKLIFSSRVNDGICDCCDGSDEYQNHSASCPNTCWVAGKAARHKLAAKISTFQQGVSVRHLQIQQAITALAADEAELSSLKAQEKTLKDLVHRLKDQKEQIEKAEEVERLRKQKEDEEAAAANEVKANHTLKEQTNDDVNEIGSVDDQQASHSHTQHDDQPSLESEEHHNGKGIEEPTPPPPPETQPHIHLENKESPNEVIHTGDDVSENTEGLSREELGRLVASRWTGESTAKQAEDVTAEKHTHNDDDDDNNNNEDVEEPIKDPHTDEDDTYASETDERYDDDNDADDDFREEDPLESTSSYKDEDTDTESDFSDTTGSSNPSLMEKIQQKFRNILHAVNLFQTPVNQSDAARIRKEFDESSGKLSKIQSRISSLTQKLKHDFGPDKEFYSFYDKCFESKESKYVYKVCPYKHASQEEGHSSTRLGRWDKFEDSYKVMVFANGDKCWNGPDRSLTVKLRCGLKNEVTDVDEPSRCEYVALLSTPALCVEGRLKELQHKLDEMNKDQPQKHDEL